MIAAVCVFVFLYIYLFINGSIQSPFTQSNHICVMHAGNHWSLLMDVKVKHTYRFSGKRLC